MRIVLVGQFVKETVKVTPDRKAPVAAGIMLAMIILMMLNIVASVTAVMCAAVLMVITSQYVGSL